MPGTHQAAHAWCGWGGPAGRCERDLAVIWARCELWEITHRVCELACEVARGRALRALDAIHLATFVLARRELEGMELLTVDPRLQASVAERRDAGN
jgi:predicted nucleic acid-binding protein